jgi:hypothetical protein
MPPEISATNHVLNQVGVGNRHTSYLEHTHGRRLSEQTVSSHESPIAKGFVNHNIGTQTSLKTDRFVTMGMYQ